LSAVLIENGVVNVKKRKSLFVATILVIVLVGVSACSNSSNDDTSNTSEPENLSQSSDDLSPSNDSTSENTSNSDNNGNDHSDGTTNENSNEQVGHNQEQANNTEEMAPTDTEMEENEIQNDNTTETITKISGRRTEFIEKLDNIQKELDSLPEKEASDNGVTNAMKSYYGLSFEKYDKALNEIYALLQQELSPEIMKELKPKQIEWIEQKEELAHEARQQYIGTTFENVAYFISLYDSTKEKCYELVNEYMTD
jgi:uncharacterized protein YecT (DUF1311 family)